MGSKCETHYCDKSTPSITFPNWMSFLNNEAELKDLTIPGTHESCALHGIFFAINQTWSLENQLNAGIRFFDLRMRLYYNTLRAHHGMIINKSISFDVKTLMLNDKIENFLIMDISLLSYNGDHILCETKPLFLKYEKMKIRLDDPSINYIGKIVDDRYNVTFKFLFNKKTNEYSLDYTELRLNKNFIYSLLPK